MTASVAATIPMDVPVSLAVVAMGPVVVDAPGVMRVVVKARITVGFVTATGDADAGLISRASSTEPYVARWTVTTKTTGTISHRDPRSHKPATLPTQFTDRVISC